MLEQAAGVAVVAVGRGRERAHPAADVLVAEDALHDRLQAGVGDLAGEVVEEAVELLRVAAHGRGEAGRVGVRRGLDRAHVELQPVAVALDPAEHAHRIALAEARVEQVDVVPDSGLDAAARVDELDGEIGRSVLRPEPPLARDRVHAFDDAVLGQLGDRAHGAQSRPGSGC